MSEEKSKSKIMISLTVFNNEDIARNFIDFIKANHSVDLRLIHVPHHESYVVMVPIDSFNKVAQDALLFMSSTIMSLEIQMKDSHKESIKSAQTENERIIEIAGKIVNEALKREDRDNDQESDKSDEIN